MMTHNKAIAGISMAWLVVLALIYAPPSYAQDNVSSFYKGKNVFMVIGSAAGGGFDTYGRLVARYIGKYIPGQPNVVPQNMPGAGGSAAAYHVAQVAAADGTFIAAVHPAVIMDPILGDRAKIKFDPSALNWIGSANSDVYVCVVRSDAPVKTFADAMKTEIVLGGSSDAASTREFPSLLNNVLGTKFKIVSGYAGNRETTLAIDKGEIQGICGAAWSSVQAIRPQWFKDGTVHVLVQEDVNGHPDLNAQGIPRSVDFASTDQQRALMKLYYSQEIFGRPYLMAKDVPSERVQAVRKAFIAALHDADLLADAQKLSADVIPVAGEDLQTLVKQIYAAEPQTIAALRAALGYQK
jgi:tripartite-type tricarboxylate transporter receptor subunit TctC